MAAKPPSTAELSPDGVVIEGNPSSSTIVATPPPSESRQSQQQTVDETQQQLEDKTEGGEEFNIDAFEIAKHSASKDELGNKKQEVKTSPENDDKMTPAEADVRKKQELNRPNDLKPVPPTKTQQTQQKTKTVTPRDVSDLPEEDREMFSTGMNNEAFNKLKPMYKEFGTLKAAQEESAKKLQENEALIAQLKQGLQPVPENYYEHENAFVLTPEFSQASERVSLAESVRNHWQTQLQRVLEGEKTVTSLVKDAQGTIRLSQPIPVDAQTENVLRNNLAFSLEQLGQTKASLESVANQFKAKAKEASTWLGQWEKGTFPIFDKAEGKELGDQAKDLLSKFPPAYRSNPLIQALTKSLVLNTKFAAAIQQMQQSTKTNGSPAKTVPAKTVTAKAPSLAEVNGDGGDGKPGEHEVSIDDFEKVKMGL